MSVDEKTGLAWKDGELVEAGTLPWLSEPGLLTGDGVFETLRVEAGAVVDPGAHLERLAEGLDVLGLEPPESSGRLLEALEAVTRSLPWRDARLRVTVARRADGRPPLRLVHAAPYEPPSSACYRRGVPVVALQVPRVDGDDPLTKIKSLSWGRYAWAGREARRRGAFDALLLNLEGRLAEASRCNVVVRVGGGLVTPPVADGCLPGTVRRRLLEAGLVREAPVAEAELREVGEMLLTNSLVGMLPVAELDGRRLHVGRTAAELAGALPR